MRNIFCSPFLQESGKRRALEEEPWIDEFKSIEEMDLDESDEASARYDE